MYPTLAMPVTTTSSRTAGCRRVHTAPSRIDATTPALDEPPSAGTTYDPRNRQ